MGDVVTTYKAFTDVADTAEKLAVIASRGSDLTAPLFKDEDNRSGIIASTDDQIMLTSASMVPLGGGDPDVLLHMARNLSTWLNVSTQHDPNSSEFVWARVRVLFSCGSFALHSELADILCNTYGMCPLNPAETEDEWNKHLAKAHQMCGWPVTFGNIPWTSFYSTDDEVREWHRVAAAFHVFKHVRTGADGESLTVYYKGMSARVNCSSHQSNIIGHNKFAVTNLCSALRTSGKSPLGTAVAQLFNQLKAGDLLTRLSTSKLPPQFLAGPYTKTKVDPQDNGWIQHGTALEFASVAEKGKVREVQDEGLVMAFDWNVTTAHHEAVVDMRNEVMAALPKTYESAWPADQLFACFSNLVPDSDLNAQKSVVDAVIACDLMRTGEAAIPGLRKEFPIVAILAEVPTPDESTNQGKSSLALCLSRALVPGITLIKAPDSSSAPDIRALADQVRTFGTLCLDEYKIPKAQAHVLSRDNLQAITTGCTITSGKVMENAGTLTLAHPLVLCGKTVDFGPDLVNRTLPLWLGQLSDAQRMNGAAYQKAMDGTLGMSMRLGCLDKVEESGLYDYLSKLPGGGTGSRFNLHRAAAAFIYHIRTSLPIEQAYTAIDACHRRGVAHLNAHMIAADENGTTDSLESGTNLRFTLSHLVENLESVDLNALHQLMPSKGGLSVKKLIRAVREVQGLDTTGPFHRLLEGRGGRHNHKTPDKAIVNALCSSIRTLMPSPTGSAPLEAETNLKGMHYYWQRTNERGGDEIRIRLVKTDLDAMPGV